MSYRLHKLAQYVRGWMVNGGYFGINEWLKSQGLIDIRTMWMKAHGYS